MDREMLTCTACVPWRRHNSPGQMETGRQADDLAHHPQEDDAPTRPEEVGVTRHGEVGAMDLPDVKVGIESSATGHHMAHANTATGPHTVTIAAEGNIAVSAE